MEGWNFCDSPPAVRRNELREMPQAETERTEPDWQELRTVIVEELRRPFPEAYRAVVARLTRLVDEGG